MDADGLLSVSARELRSGVEASITVKPSYGLADDDITRMLQDSFSSAESDMQQRALKEEQVEAERILLATQSALGEDAQLLSASEQEAIRKLMGEVRRLTQGVDQHALKNAITALAEGTEEFAARRMDQSVRTALTGKKLNDIA